MLSKLPMPPMHESFAFVDDGRTFRCCVEPARRLQAEAWWWFQVSTENHQRYAPFRAEPTDTTDAIRHRVVAYYDNLLARRAEPNRGRWPQGRAFVTASTAAGSTAPVSMPSMPAPDTAVTAAPAAPR